MSTPESKWDTKIIEKMHPGAVTFAWDDGEIVTIPAPAGALKSLQTAWEWVDPQLREFAKGKGRPRSVCLRLDSGEFRGLKFPDVNTSLDPYD
ncbi:hypothetical protein [Desulfomonile tiedjei]|uniref:Uncharacterized protein n=1 Tax=Desulfomonile tiedjei (strain ATCC 49306 / DSM 6799 / DCB-1) TaxID=706587 RepID=I4C6G4_DESTA|nr:hypothetical protein [Desulfomonile tiedjei]AFM25155.1 hypothetical protein Desti_2474 [Desulfomonile tiedjei DSM 6799]